MELDIFEHLYQEKNHVTAGQLAEKHKFKVDILERLLNCLVSLKLVSKSKDGAKGITSSIINIQRECRPKVYFGCLQPDCNKIAHTTL